MGSSQSTQWRLLGSGRTYSFAFLPKVTWRAVAAWPPVQEPAMAATLCPASPERGGCRPPGWAVGPELPLGPLATCCGSPRICRTGRGQWPWAPVSHTVSPGAPLCRGFCGAVASGDGLAVRAFTPRRSGRACPRVVSPSGAPAPVFACRYVSRRRAHSASSVGSSSPLKPPEMALVQPSQGRQSQVQLPRGQSCSFLRLPWRD